MSKAARMFTMMGLGLMAGATMAAGPALAAGGADAPAAKPATTTKVQKQADRGRDRVVGYFRSRGACEQAGRVGEWRDRWDDYDCDRVRFGFKRGLWALEVEQNWRGGGHWGHGGGRGHGHGHGHHGGHHRR